MHEVDFAANNRFFVVITTIQEPTPSVRKVAGALDRLGGHLLIVGDRKGPKQYDVPGTELPSFEAQLETPFRLARLLPEGHYARKNLGYLAAFQRGATCIYETDDDNAPLPNWGGRSCQTMACMVRAERWINVYGHFSDEHVWPRGFPLEEVRRPVEVHDQRLCSVMAPIQQGLANGSPDVDATWRLIYDRAIDFKLRAPLALEQGTWCPFNSQATWWWRDAFPLMYLPSRCPFRMTDIWRSFIAQRCLWELGGCLVFHAAEVYQDRNQHNLMADFRDEIPGYLRNNEIVDALSQLGLIQGQDGAQENLVRCYERLVQIGVFDSVELELVHSWIEDLNSLDVFLHA